MRLGEEVVVQLLDDFEGAFLADALFVVGGPADDLDGDEDAAGGASADLAEASAADQAFQNVTAADRQQTIAFHEGHARGHGRRLGGGRRGAGPGGRRVVLDQAAQRVVQPGIAGLVGLQRRPVAVPLTDAIFLAEQFGQGVVGGGGQFGQFFQVRFERRRTAATAADLQVGFDQLPDGGRPQRVVRRRQQRCQGDGAAAFPRLFEAFGQRGDAPPFVAAQGTTRRPLTHPPPPWFRRLAGMRGHCRVEGEPPQGRGAGCPLTGRRQWAKSRSPRKRPPARTAGRHAATRTASGAAFVGGQGYDAVPEDG